MKNQNCRIPASRDAIQNSPWSDSAILHFDSWISQRCRARADLPGAGPFQLIIGY
jgi:hypothetical protein